MFLVVENVRRKQLQWLAYIREVKGWNDAELARRTGRNAATFSKFENDPANEAQLSPKTVSLIEQASGIPAYQSEKVVKPRGLAEVESAPYEAEQLTAIDGAVKALKADRNAIDPWVLHSRCLEAAGYMPGDILMVDLNARPTAGDVVCAQVYDRTGRAETIFRLYEDPFLVAATLDKTVMKPHLIDNDRVVVRGVVIASFRERRAA